jgi:hypothetical protein
LPALGPVVDALQSLAFPLGARTLAFVRTQFSIVGRFLAIVRDAVSLVGDAVALVGSGLAPGELALAPRQHLSAVIQLGSALA